MGLIRFLERLSLRGWISLTAVTTVTLRTGYVLADEYRREPLHRVPQRQVPPVVTRGGGDSDSEGCSTAGRWTLRRRAGPDEPAQGRLAELTDNPALYVASLTVPEVATPTVGTFRRAWQWGQSLFSNEISSRPITEAERTAELERLWQLKWGHVRAAAAPTAESVVPKQDSVVECLATIATKQELREGRALFTKCVRSAQDTLSAPLDAKDNALKCASDLQSPPRLHHVGTMVASAALLPLPLPHNLRVCTVGLAQNVAVLPMLIQKVLSTKLSSLDVVEPSPSVLSLAASSLALGKLDASSAVSLHYRSVRSSGPTSSSGTTVTRSLEEVAVSSRGDEASGTNPKHFANGNSGETRAVVGGGSAELDALAFPVAAAAVAEANNYADARRKEDAGSYDWVLVDLPLQSLPKSGEGGGALKEDGEMRRFIKAAHQSLSTTGVFAMHLASRDGSRVVGPWAQFSSRGSDAWRARQWLRAVERQFGASNVFVVPVAPAWTRVDSTDLQEDTALRGAWDRCVCRLIPFGSLFCRSSFEPSDSLVVIAMRRLPGGDHQVSKQALVSRSQKMSEYQRLSYSLSMYFPLWWKM